MGPSRLLLDVDTGTENEEERCYEGRACEREDGERELGEEGEGELEAEEKEK